MFLSRWDFVFKGNVCLRLHFPWTMKHLTISVLCAAFVVIFIMIKVTVQQDETLYRGSEQRHASFVEHLHSVLDVSAMISHKVCDALYCAFSCLRNARCFSFNVATFPDADGNYECQLLDTDRYNSSSHWKPSKKFNHHSIPVRKKLELLSCC